MSGTIAIIPARGGSKRIPRKNIVDFRGRPMIAWSIDAALRVARFDRVIVSTDDPEIAEVARAVGADVPFLRDVAADDLAPVSDATLTALAQAEVHFEHRWDVVVQLMPNCPLRGAADIRDALETFDAHDRDFQISCFRYGWMNPWWAHTLDTAGRAVPLHPEALQARSQDLPELYCPTGAVWVARTEALESAGTFYGEGYAMHPLSWSSALDIDDEEDLRMAEAVAATSAVTGEP